VSGPGGPLELVVERQGERVQLLSPGVGEFTAAAPLGALLGPGASAGRLVTLGRSQPLIVPAGVAGVVRAQPHERVHAPVGYRTLLYELEPLASVGASAAPAAETRADGALLVRAPQAGRFYHRSAPSEPPLAVVGRALTPGTPLGLIEVMKTFTHIVYPTGAGLPEHARIARVLAADGADVHEGEPLVEVEPAR
jgi:biotin carboxyl carrier protein